MRFVIEFAALGVLATLSIGCSGSGVESARATVPPYIESGDLKQIRARGKLRILLPMTERGGQLRGEDPLEAERELVLAFARQQELEPYWIYVHSRGDLIPYLLAGKGDIAAANLTATDDRRKQVEFSVPVSFVREQVVTRHSDVGIGEAADLVGRRVAVRRSSSFRETLDDLRVKYPGIRIDDVPEYLDTDEIIHGVANRRFDVTVADSNVVEAALGNRDDVRVAFELTGDRPIAWAVRKDSKLLLQNVNLFLAEAQLSQRRNQPRFGDLGEIRERRVLRVLTRNSPVTYFLWRGKLMGFEYELAQRFAQQQGLGLEIIVPQEQEEGSLLTMLLEGKGDVVAAGLTPTEIDEGRGVAFSRPYHYVAPMLVSRPGGAAPHGLADLAGRSIYVQHSSPYWEMLSRMPPDIGFALHAAPEEFDTEEIIALVADGTYDLSVADSHSVDIEITWRDDVEAAFPLSDAMPVSWAVRESNPELLAAVDEFVRQAYRGLFYNVIYDKYFRDRKRIRRHQEYRNESGELSPYDRIVKRQAEKHGFDWRLITSQMYQESEFDPGALSFAGAVGLLQVLPRTAEQLGLGDLANPEANIAAGVEYLAWVRDRFEVELPYWERMWFTLAAYNAGHGHVLDARRLAAKLKLDPDRWFGNVERAMLLLARPEHALQARHGYCRGSEPVNYVREIRSRYEAYLQTLVSEPPPDTKARAALSSSEFP